ncbi:hypothetical protein F4825DRAFT_474304 [Nemania diffusa]|nr:hypothetical protein F4825DRAFT_474304 [Nemania diffusa]
MQANLFKILAIAAAFSAVHSAPVETAEGQVAQGQVNGTQVDGTQVNGTQANKAHTNETQVSDKISLFKSCKLAIRREMLLSASKREREISSRVLAGITTAGWTLNVSHGDVANAFSTLTCVATRGMHAISVRPKEDSLLWRRSMDMGVA